MNESRPKLTIDIPGQRSSEERIRVSLKASPILGNLASIFNDLLISGLTALEGYNRSSSGKPADLAVVRACWEAAITSYSRCFEEGRGVDKKTRTRLDDFVVNLSPELKACHDEARRLRGRSIGHHVAKEGGQDIDFFLERYRTSPTSSSLDLSVRIETEMYDRAFLKQLEELTQLLRGEVGKRIDELRTELLQQAIADQENVLKAFKQDDVWSPP